MDLPHSIAQHQAHALPPKPAGGKALKRLEEFLLTRDMTDSGAELIAHANPREGHRRAESGESGRRAEGARAKAAQAEAADLAKAAQDALEMLAAPAPGPLLGPVWRPLGPGEIPGGQTYGASRVTVAGRIAAIAIDPSNRNHVLVGAAAGGVWESVDAGANWAARGDAFPTLTTGAIAFDPSHPNVVYCGTGEGNWYNRWGQGVLRSTNGGTTWTLQAGAPFIGQGFYDLIVDPANSNNLIAATTAGVYTSADAGVTWTQRRTHRCWSLAMAAGEILAACDDGLQRSTNGGNTWAAVALPGAPGGWPRLAVAICRAAPHFAIAFGASGAAAYIATRDAAGAWHAVAAPAGLSTGQAWYDWYVAVQPNNANTVYLGAIDIYRGDYGTGGWAWTNISSKTAPGTDSIHPDQHALAFDPVDPNAIYAGSDGGLFYSPDRGTHWAHRNHNLAITEIEYIAQDFGSVRWIMGGTQDNGTDRYVGSYVWDHIADGDGGDCSVNHDSPDTIYHTFYGMLVQRSGDRGANWTSIGPPVPANYNALFYPPLEVCGTTVGRAGQSMWLSRNSGAAWVEQAILGNTVATAMHAPNADTVFVGCANGTIFRFDFTAGAWSNAVALTTPRAGAWISDIAVDAANLNRVWATSTFTGGGRVFRSDNGGTNWTDVSAGLPNLPINSVEIHPSQPNRAWVAADLGVWQTTDAGAHWSGFSLGLPNVLVEDLEYHPYARVLRAGTRNRGVWEIPVDGLLAEPIKGVQFTGTLQPNQTNRWFTFNWPAVWHVIWTVMPVTPKPGAPELGWTVRVERASATMATYWIEVTNLTNVPVTFEGRYEILSFY